MVGTSALWRREFNETIAELESGMSSRHAAGSVRYLISTGFLGLGDIQNDPVKFFLTHRMLAQHVPRIGSCVWARFALQYNLFAGSVMALGSPHQVTEFLFRNEVDPSLGCFAMTEQRTGDETGFLIETTAELTMDGKFFILHTPCATAAKTWISQGLVAGQAIVIATMIVHGHSCGPQAFLINLRDHEGQLVEGITMLDMGLKEAGSDMDNARITFFHLKIPLSSHLCRYMQVQNGTVRHPLGRRVRIIDVIGQRLFTARLLVAQGALAYARTKLEQASNDADASHICFVPTITSMVGPNKKHVTQAFISRAFQTLDSLDRFCAKVEAELCQCLKLGLTPKEPLQRAIAVAKVEAVETSIDLCVYLNEEPSYGMERDFLQCCRFTEGDNQMLIEKMARDLTRTDGEGSDPEVKAALYNLKEGLINVQISTKCDPEQAWDNCADLVCALADAHANSVLLSYGCLLGEDPTQ